MIKCYTIVKHVYQMNTIYTSNLNLWLDKLFKDKQLSTYIIHKRFYIQIFNREEDEMFKWKLLQSCYIILQYIIATKQSLLR